MNRRELFREAFIAGYKAGKKRLNESLPVANAVKKGAQAVGNRISQGVNQFKYAINGDDSFPEVEMSNLISDELDRVAGNGEINFQSMMSNFGKDKNFQAQCQKLLKNNDIIKGGELEGSPMYYNLSEVAREALKNFFQLNKNNLPSNNEDNLHSQNYQDYKQHVEDKFGKGSFAKGDSALVNDERGEIKVMTEQITMKILGICGLQKQHGGPGGKLLTPPF